jgi:hypothetical protein
MKKIIFLSWCVVVAWVAIGIAGSRPLTGRHHNVGFRMTPSKLRLIPLCAPFQSNMSVPLGVTVPLNPMGVAVPASKGLIGVLYVGPASGTSPGTQLDVYFQHSADDGQTWTDLSHTNIVPSQCPNTWYIPMSSVAPTGWYTQPVIGPLPTVYDGQLSSTVCVGGPVGKRLRVKYYMNIVGTGQFGFQAFVLPR